MRSTTPGEAFLAAVAPILDAVGPLPHARLDTDGVSTAPKKQKTRMLKCECATCGYTARTARKWLEQAGAPLCPIEDHGQMQHKPLDDDRGERSEEQTSELQSLLRISYAVFCFTKKTLLFTD